MPGPWQKVGSQCVGDFKIFRVRSDRKISPRTKLEHGFFVIEAVDWVNVIALTADGHLVMVDQFRHGSNTVELEIPGGTMEEKDGSAEMTARRELREETGYEGDNARIIGRVFPNPAIMSNTCFTVLIDNCRRIHPVEFDHCEDLTTRLVPIGEAASLVANGVIRHSLVVAALYHFELWRRGNRAA